MVTDTTTAKVSLGPLGTFVLLALSVVLNISGIASIIDGFFRWQGFFRDFLETYRAWIRHPVSWAIHLVWPASWPRIPESLFDVLIVWSGIFLAANLCSLRHYKKLFVQAKIDDEGLFKGIIFAIIAFLFFPLFIALCFLTMKDKHAANYFALETTVYFLFLVSFVIVLMFLNWQFQHHGRI